MRHGTVSIFNFNHNGLVTSHPVAGTARCGAENHLCRSMALDFPLGPLRRYLWDNISAIIPSTSVTGSWDQLGVSRTWAAGVGYEGFNGFRVELKKFAGGQSNPTFMLLVYLSPPSCARGREGTGDHGGGCGVTEHRFVLRKKPATVKVCLSHLNHSRLFSTHHPVEVRSSKRS